MRLVKRVIKEREERPLVDEYIKMIDDIVDYHSDGKYNDMIDDLNNLLDTVGDDNELSDEDVDEIYEYYDSIINGLNN
jgi:molybdopterin/thiamine biosynthesis adenylyltransferase